jgi:predicted DNA-binding protein
VTVKQETQTQTAIRLPDSLLARIDKLATHMSESDLGKRYTRAEILRMAAFRGVQQLETSYPLIGKKKR